MKNYKKDESMRDYLIRNGADIELVESPIVKEKLRNGRPYDIFKSRDFEDEMNITINEDEWNHIQEIMEASSELEKFVEYDKLIFDKYFDDYE